MSRRSCRRPCERSRPRTRTPTGSRPRTSRPTTPRASTRTTTAPTVSEAAQGATPDGATNHGQYVRTVATDNHGQATSSEHRQDGDKGAKPNR